MPVLRWKFTKNIAKLTYKWTKKTLGKIRRIPDVGYNVYKSKFEGPDKAEGFDEIVKIPFQAKFDEEKDKKLFLKWT